MAQAKSRPHRRPETTARYTLVPDASLIAAVQAAALDEPLPPLRLVNGGAKAA
jgi:hypothetical protein